MRLPAAAKQSTIGAKRSAPNTYASGAAGPMAVYRIVGRTKMLPAIVTLTIDAAIAQKPKTRANPESPGRRMRIGFIKNVRVDHSRAVRCVLDPADRLARKAIGVKCVSYCELVLLAREPRGLLFEQRVFLQ